MADVFRFWLGKHLYHIAPAAEGDGFIGICDGRIVGAAPDRPSIIRMILKTGNWR